MKFRVSSMLATALLYGFYAYPAGAEELVVVARPTKIKFVKAASELPENQVPGTIVFGGVFRTKLAIQEVLHGSLTQKSITVELVATSKGSLSPTKSIVVLLFRNEHGGYDVRGWDRIQTIACLPDRVVLDDGLESDFPIEHLASKERCQYTK